MGISITVYLANNTCQTYLHGMTDVPVASFGSAQVAAVRVGCRAGTEVQAIVSGLFTSSFALGNFCGPTISGIEGQEAGKNIT
jgi:hypothetical protein